MIRLKIESLVSDKDEDFNLHQREDASHVEFVLE